MKHRKQSAASIKKERTFAEIADLFLEVSQYRVKESTYVHYSNLFSTHIRPELGKILISELTSERIERFALQKLQNGRLDGTGGLAPKTVKDILSIIKLILGFAETHQYLNSNAILFNTPKQRKRDINVLSHEEQGRLELYLLRTPSPSNMGMLLCLYTGLRLGEICALQWKDIDLEAQMISVRRTMLRINNLDPSLPYKTKILIDRPKTAASERVIPLSIALVSQLHNIRNDDISQKCYFLTGREDYIEPRAYYARFQTVLKRCGIQHYSFHTLRHTFATRCIESDCDPKSLSEILGHSDVKITLDRYVHPSLEWKRSQMEKMSKSMMMCKI